MKSSRLEERSHESVVRVEYRRRRRFFGGLDDDGHHLAGRRCRALRAHGRCWHEGAVDRCAPTQVPVGAAAKHFPVIVQRQQPDDDPLGVFGADRARPGARYCPRRVEMPVRFSEMCTRAEKPIHKNPEAGPREHRSLMHKRAIAVVGPLEDVQVGLAAPVVYRGARRRVPVEWAGSQRLRPAVDHEGVVISGGTKTVPQHRITRVAGGTRIDEEWLPADAECHRQCVGVRVAAVQIAMRTAIDHEVVAAVGSRHEVAAGA